MEHSFDFMLFDTPWSWFINRLRTMVELVTCSGHSRLVSLIETQKCITHVFNSQIKNWMFIFPPADLLMHLSYLGGKSQRKSFVLYLWGVLAFTSI